MRRDLADKFKKTLNEWQAFDMGGATIVCLGASLSPIPRVFIPAFVALYAISTYLINRHYTAKLIEVVSE